MVFPARPVFATSEFVTFVVRSGTDSVPGPELCPHCETAGMRTVPMPIAGTGTGSPWYGDVSEGNYFASLYAARTSAEIRPRSLTS
ncbi:hypothetical protein EV138_4159 [Kribbella voronezhensis]|uniref:Uncharacterized protein n=1 Tax=Kribbella voronezhensis TaxID=2512212 RepID=A0A4R7TGI7_9ACTN|nr:hypothetical protein EV138_4159 [Kribbella voronezhensis]